MKKLKRTLAMAIVFVMALMLTFESGLTALAAGDLSITVKPADGETGHTYKAYQIFQGDVTQNADTATKEDHPYILANIVWGGPFATIAEQGDPAKTYGDLLIEALKSNEAFGTASANLFAACKSADDVAGVISDFGDDSAQAIAFAKAVGKFIKDNSLDASGTSVAGDGANQVISGLNDGYYIVLDESGNVPAFSRNMLHLIGGDLDITAKIVLPTLEKDITSPNVTGGKGKYNTASIGDTIEFKLTSKVPDMTGYSKYFFVVNDTMSKGLTFDPKSLKIKIDGVGDLTEITDYKVYVYANPKDGSTRVEIVFQNFIKWQSNEGKDIEITYSALLNGDAEPANPNTADLTYSKDPNVDPKGDGNPNYDPENPGNPGDPEDPDDPDTPTNPDDPNDHPDDDRPKPPSGDDPEEPGYDPGDSDVSGTTTPSKTVTYVTSVEITKTGVGTESSALAGAEFEITGQSSEVVVTTSGKMIPDANGQFYKLKDGTYTLVSPDKYTESKYEEKVGDTHQKYKLVPVTAEDVNPAAVKITATAISGTDGKIKFEGLGEGTYTITEINAPSGYNKLKKPIEITITATPTATGCTWAATLTNSNAQVTVNNNVISFTVNNNKGTILPTTGGMGTTLFYVLGSILVACAVLYLITKKRMSVEEN